MTRTRGDTIPDSARSVMRVISLGGAGGDPGVADVIDGALASLIRKRRVKWHRRFAEAVAEIGARAGEPELAALCRNEHFLTVAPEAAQIAWRNHHDDKLSALKCAVIHSATSDQRLLDSRTTEFGKTFLSYIGEPWPARRTL